MHYYQHHIGDFLRDAGGLSNDALGAYMRLLWRYYAEERPITGDLSDIAFDAASTPEIVRQLLRRFFVQTDEGWRHGRCDEEIARYKAKAGKAAESANARWKNANAMRTHSERNANEPVLDANQEPRTNNHKEQEQPPCAQAAPAHGEEVPQIPKQIRAPKSDAPKTTHRFAEFWAAYPIKKGRADAVKKWASKGLDAIADQIIAHVRRMERKDAQWKRGFIPHGSTYINAEGWQDEPAPDPDDIARAATTPAPAVMGAKAALEPKESPQARAVNWVWQQFHRGDFGSGADSVAERERQLAEVARKYQTEGDGDGND